MANHKRQNVPPSAPDVMDFTKLSRLRKMVNTLESAAGPQNDMDVSFEYIAASLFPNLYNNVREKMTQQYIEGYNKGKSEK